MLGMNQVQVIRHKVMGKATRFDLWPQRSESVAIRCASISRRASQCVASMSYWRRSTDARAASSG